MGKNTNIEWTDHTFNPWIGCDKVSAGCKNCYAAALDKRWGHDRWGPTRPRERTSAPYWKQALRWNELAKKVLKPARVFCASMADVFDDHASIHAEWRIELFQLIRTTTHLDWLLLTKRPENIRPMVEKAMVAGHAMGEAFRDTLHWLHEWFSTCVPANIWLGTTVEDQEQAARRIPELLKVPARVHFLSCEPLLERIQLYPWLAHAPKVAAGHCMLCGQVAGAHIHNREFPHVAGWSRIDWIIVGGESGAKARPFDIGWARDLRDQCADADVAFFCKQLGALAFCTRHDSDVRDVGTDRPVMATKDKKGGDIAEFPSDLRIRQFPEVRS